MALNGRVRLRTSLHPVLLAVLRQHLQRAGVTRKDGRVGQARKTASKTGLIELPTVTQRWRLPPWRHMMDIAISLMDAGVTDFSTQAAQPRRDRQFLHRADEAGRG